MMEPLPAVSGAVEPQKGSRLFSKRLNAPLIVMPISKQRPLEDRCPSFIQRQKRII